MSNMQYIFAFMKAKEKKYGSAKIDPMVLYDAKVISATNKKSLFEYITEAVKSENKKHKK